MSFQEVLRRRAGLIGCGEVPPPSLAEVESFGCRAAVVFGFVAFLPENCRSP